MKLRPLLSGQSRRPSGARRLHVVAPCGGQRTPCFRRKVKEEKTGTMERRRVAYHRPLGIKIPTDPTARRASRVGNSFSNYGDVVACVRSMCAVTQTLRMRRADVRPKAQLAASFSEAVRP